MNWVRGRTIGRGSTAVVSHAECYFSGEEFAVKSAEVSLSEPLRKEARVLSTLECPHIVGYRGCDVTREKDGLLLNLLLEYLPDGSLSEVIRKLGRLEEAVIVEYARQILDGLDYLHSRGIVHCDVKPSNILIGHGNCAKIADFGCAKSVVEVASAEIGGTPMYMAPEAACGVEQGCPADVWAFGCTVLEMSTGKFPWYGVCDPVSAVHKIVYSGESPEIPGHVSPHGKDFLEKCLRRNPKERWTVGQLLCHPFLDRVNCGVDVKQAEESSLSPTSVMDREFWDSDEVTCRWIAQTTGACSPTRGRVEKLQSGDDLLPIWSNDGGWIDARGGEEGETTASDCFQEWQEQSDILVGGQKSLESVVKRWKLSGFVNCFDLLCFSRMDSKQSIQYFL